MNTRLKKVETFIAERHRKRLLLLIGKQWWLLSLFLISFSAVLHLLFAFLPWTALPFIWDAAVLCSVAGFFIVTLDILLLRRPPVFTTTRLLEKIAAVKLRHPLLTIAYELRKPSKENSFHKEIYRFAAEQIPVYRSITLRKKNRHLLTVTLLSLIVCATQPLYLNPLLITYWRLPLTMFQKNNLEVFPGSIMVPRYASVKITLHPEHRGAPSCRISLTSMPQGKTSVKWLRPDSVGTFSVRLDSLEESFAYHFIYGARHCSPETVTVVQPPLIHRLLVTLHPPAYTGLPPVSLPEGQGDFTAYPGTRAALSIESRHLSSAEVRYGGCSVPLKTGTTSAKGEFNIDKTGSYCFSLTDTFSQTNDSVACFSVGLIPDEVPTVRFLRPGRNKELEPAQRESLWVEAADDLGIRSCLLYWCKSGSPGDNRSSNIDLSPSTPTRLLQKQFIWEISRLSLYPGDSLFYWARVRDSKAFGGAHYAVSDTFWFRIPTFSEIHRSMAQREEYAKETIGSVQKRQRELLESVEQLDKAPTDSKEMTWNQKQLVEKIEQTMRSQADSLKRSLEQLEKNVEQMRKEGSLNSEIVRKMNDIQKAVNELVALYGDSLLFPRDKTGKLTLSDMRRAVDRLQDILPELEERLDNTLQFLETLKRDRELAMLAMRAEKLAGEQAALAENPRDSRSGTRQKDILDRIGKLSNDLNKAGLQQTDTGSSRQLQQIDSLGTRMNRQLGKRQLPDASTMREMSGSLASLSESLRQMMSSYMQEQMEALKQKLLELINSSLNLAAWQEEIRTSERKNEHERRRQATAQQALNEAIGLLGQETDSLFMLPPSLRGKLRNDLTAAQQAARAAIKSLGASDGRFSMQISERSLKKFTGTLLETFNALNRQSGGSCSNPGGIRESLRKLSGKQAAINAATAQLLRAMMQGQQPGGGTGSGYSAADIENARKEAQERQQALAEELKKLAEKFGDGSSEEMMGRVKELEKEARKITRLLNEPREEVTERQDRFLARMLQSALSLHREEEGKEQRKSAKAGIVFTKTIVPLSDSTIIARDAFHMLRRRALENGNFPPSYRTSINTYFDSLGIRYLK